jgi:hypothetical protein
MASFNSIGTYTATSLIPEFRGLMQYGSGIGTDPRYALEAVNAVTTGGMLQPLGMPVPIPGPAQQAPIDTLMCLHRRWYADDKDLLVAYSGGRLWAKTFAEEAWTELGMPEGLTTFSGSTWSWVAYEINPEGAEDPVDVLLISNAQDGMFMLRGDTLTVSAVATPKRFGVIERYAERIWGGAIPDDPDMLVYSAPFDPTNWQAQTEIPEDGAGDVMQPSWDGDSFTALKAFGSQLIAFKKSRVWRVLGTNPGEYTFKEQYGGGAPYVSTIAVDTERIFMLTDRGIAIYDGAAVTPFCQEYAQDLFRRMNTSALDGAVACIWRGTYYCAIPIDGSEVNNAVLCYSTTENTWLLHTAVEVSAFLPTEERLLITSPTAPCLVMAWTEDSWQAQTKVAPLRWVSPWNDLDHKDVVKGGFEVYLLVESKAPTELRISLQTDKKTKTKRYAVQPPAPGRNARVRRLHSGSTGGRFRLIIESHGGSVPWRLVSGIMIESELDPD